MAIPKISVTIESTALMILHHLVDACEWMLYTVVPNIPNTTARASNILTETVR